MAEELRRVRGEGRALLAVVEESLSGARVEEGPTGPRPSRHRAVSPARAPRRSGGSTRDAGERGAAPAASTADAARIAAAVSRLRTLVEHGLGDLTSASKHEPPCRRRRRGHREPKRRSSPRRGAGDDPGRRRRRGESRAPGATARARGSPRPDGQGRPRGARPRRERAGRSGPPRRHDAGPRRTHACWRASSRTRTRRHIPVLMISALDETASVVRSIELGAEDYLPKPCDPVLLRARIGACLEKKRLRDQDALHVAELAELEPHPRAARPGAGRPGRAPRPPQAVLLAPARRADRGRRRRRSAPHPPARDHRRLPGPARLHRLRRDGRAGRGDGRAPRVPRGDGPVSSSSTRARSSGSRATA